MKLKYDVSYKEEILADEGGSKFPYRVIVTGDTEYLKLLGSSQVLLKIHKDDINRIIDLLTRTKTAIAEGDKIIEDMEKTMESKYKIRSAKTIAEEQKANMVKGVK